MAVLRAKISVPSRGFCFRTYCTRSAGFFSSTNFRPLTGILFSNVHRLRHLSGKPPLFPSPHGDFVFERRVLRRQESRLPTISVPSRGFCFRTKGEYHDEREKFQKNFRPLTGILFSNRASTVIRMYATANISVPSRGFCFRTHAMAMGILVIGEIFPSPHGDFVFEPFRALLSNHHERRGFPSPHGDFVFERGRASTVIREFGSVISVPSRGFCFRT